jgi:5'-nucleotidase, C-terminal domain
MRRALSTATVLPILVLGPFAQCDAALASNASFAEPPPCVDRALRRLLDRPDSSSSSGSSCGQPRLATDFCHGPVGTSCQRPTSSSSLPQSKNHPRAISTDACGLVTHALWVEAHHWQEPKHTAWDVVVLIPAGTCVGPIKAGPIYQHELESNRTFVNEPLVSLRVNGSHLLEILEHSLELRHLLMQRDAQPRVSGMQFWVRPNRRNNATSRIFRPGVLHRGTCRWKPVDSAALYNLVTVPSLVKRSRHLLHDVPVKFIGDRGPHNSYTTVTIAAAVWSYAQQLCRVEDPAEMVAAILAGGGGSPRTRSGGIQRSAVTSSLSSASPVCEASRRPPRKKSMQSHARAANRTYHSRLATW